VGLLPSADGRAVWVHEHSYDVSPDGQRLLMVKPSAGGEPDARPRIVIVTHWLTELQRLVPVK
jgi:hypothetical protein